MTLGHAQFKALFTGLDWRRVRAVEARVPTAIERVRHDHSVGKFRPLSEAEFDNFHHIGRHRFAGRYCCLEGVANRGASA
ncbi:hypothetical protein [Rhizobium leguminosarum]|uniref:hypothetical protein n=1 Tax=Rhizobium leguminosarum TaxID=384 RepID=UPI001495C52D|nr:hypothetical protein [Rhizobium leguminosarum]